MLSTDDRQQISQTLALHAYVFDHNQLDRIDELFTADAVYDMRPVGMGVFHGTTAIAAAAAELAAQGHAPQAHLVTNIVFADSGGTDEGATPVTSTGLLIMPDGSVRVVVHDDTLRLHEGRWLIDRRVISPIHASLSADQARRA